MNRNKHITKSTINKGCETDRRLSNMHDKNNESKSIFKNDTENKKNKSMSINKYPKIKNSNDLELSNNLFKLTNNEFFKKMKNVSINMIKQMTSHIQDLGYVKYIKPINYDKELEQMKMKLKKSKEKHENKTSNNFYFNKIRTTISLKKNNTSRSSQQSLFDIANMIANNTKLYEYKSLNKSNKKNKTMSDESIINFFKSSNIFKNKSSEKSAMIKKYSDIDRIFLKFLDKDEIIDDYINNNKPFDKFSKFKKRLLRERINIDKLLSDLDRQFREHDYNLKIGLTKLKLSFKYFKSYDTNNVNSNINSPKLEKSLFNPINYYKL